MESINPILHEKHQRDLILEHAQALYGAEYQYQSYTWSVILSKTNDAQYRAHVIYYERTGSYRKWATLKSGAKAQDVKRAMVTLLDELREEIGTKFFR